ncbi:glutamate synthase large subunit [Lacicoccus qingdaonensis]|uniref:Glutamate synthase (NADPH/NADH) large chain n=1 Tax=Lacicoccus qingdaonensis TaxID=576118 RepID=A0A1G9H4V2_9BACL|nr:glutamate synthase large subunit [Salinicoccus qingdaonensis]SDL07869.1 glutamate synthase (NADPH/NADH) large chain [Salinicoccus qingdaonensis]
MSLYQNIDQYGLYDSKNERDACGIGFYANMDNLRTHDIVLKSLEMLTRLDHRGGIGADGMTGDGAGIMTEIPHDLLKEEYSELPEFSRYSVGMYMLESGASLDEFKMIVEETINTENEELIAFRKVPVDESAIAEHVKQTMPYFIQVITKCHDPLDLYYLRKMIEQNLNADMVEHYVSSFSNETIVYKGWLRAEQIKDFYIDLNNPDYISKFGMVHSRFSTNTFPSWARAHPNRLLMHNGEINTIKGNASWMQARTNQWLKDVYGKKGEKISEIIDGDGSDSAMVDNVLEFMSLVMPPEEAAMIMIPEPWKYQDYNNAAVKDFYEFYSYIMEPWDGPTMISFCDNHKIGALTDRNGLRPGRYYVTDKNEIIYSSEVGVVDVDEDEVIYKGQLSPGKLLLVDFETSRIIENDELKNGISSKRPYGKWLDRTSEEPSKFKRHPLDKVQLQSILVRFGYTKEDIEKYMKPLSSEVKDPIGAMGFDMPLAFLSDDTKSLFDYFKQHFAQVTNPPLDSYREKIVTSEITYLGGEGHLLKPDKNVTDRIQLEGPVIDNGVYERDDVKALGIKKIDITYNGSLEKSLDNLIEEAVLVADKYGVILLTDEAVLEDESVYVMPPLLVTSAVHQALIKADKRISTSIIIKSAEVREVHHVAALIGFGANAVDPYIAQETLLQYSAGDPGTVKQFNKGLTAGLIKVMAKMGISTVQSYHGAQIFEAVGLSKKLMAKYFGSAVSKIGGLSIEDIDRNIKEQQDKNLEYLESGSKFQWRQQGDHHVINPTSIRMLREACMTNDREKYNEYKNYMNDNHHSSIRHLLKFKTGKPIPLEMVEPAKDIVKRFKSGAMSYGSLSEEAHQTLAEAMNRIGGKSNSGEGGENPERATLNTDGSNYNSAIKQVASGRFGVNSEYLNSAEEIQIKVAQGAKPGEGGQLPGEKVYPWIAETRNSTPGVGLISPPPHHDIYSIEDLAQLIHDLKNANKNADISVKLVAKDGVGTIAAGVAKAYADKIVISGYDGGTGASPMTSIQHTGLPWELGLTEAHQTLILNGLRSRVTIETDGKLMTGRDVAMAAALGAEEYAFATAPLVVLGCIMMRVCHKDTCPVGIATQNGDLRKLFSGKADHVVNFMNFIAEDIREILSELGLKSMDELVGAVNHLEVDEAAVSRHRMSDLDLEPILTMVEGDRFKSEKQKHPFEHSLDETEVIPDFTDALEKSVKKEAAYKVTNRHRDIGTRFGSMITDRFGMKQLAHDYYKLNTYGHGGQSYGAFIPQGMTLHHTGDLNDYVGKGLSGGRIIVQAPNIRRSHEIITGNVCLYGAISGQVFINGTAGERFGVRNSGANVVVEGLGDHGLEYMTGGRVVILGDIGKNFAAGMSGGIAYIINERSLMENKLNMNTEAIETGYVEDSEEIEKVKELLYAQKFFTGSRKAEKAVDLLENGRLQIIKVIPVEYKEMQQKIQHGLRSDQSRQDAELNAFYGTGDADAKELESMNIH